MENVRVKGDVPALSQRVVRIVLKRSRDDFFARQCRLETIVLRVCTLSLPTIARLRPSKGNT
ncbi:hypothetical protein BDZ94DRAFT_1244487 [Collybia nuda]|uniref:Uncharacterized protein n=1 Tax=Collybia nuda TaxID=64659 RepID=A0A9P6CK21_9AGAR|nr:hypothetical protein BDZ94DRAFT_1244487 [Collybia nuda]